MSTSLPPRPRRESSEASIAAPPVFGSAKAKSFAEARALQRDDVTEEARVFAQHDGGGVRVLGRNKVVLSDEPKESTSEPVVESDTVDYEAAFGSENVLEAVEDEEALLELTSAADAQTSSHGLRATTNAPPVDVIEKSGSAEAALNR